MTSPRRSSQRLDAWIVCVLTIIGLCLFAASESAFYGDAITYASDTRAGVLIEPGHLLWRPFMKIIEIAINRDSSYSSVLWQFQFACLAASVLAMIAMYLLASPMYGRLAAALTAALMAVSNGFWTYSFSGCSYSLSVLFAILALHVAISDRAEVTPRRALLAGLLGGLSAGTWAIQALVAPAIWLVLVLTPPRAKFPTVAHVKHTVALAAGYSITFVIPVLLAYLIQSHWNASAWQAAARPGAPGLGAWASASAHGIPAHFGLAQGLRVALGWPQSFVSLANVGSKLRLWRLHEAAFPASAWLLLPIAFYCALACVIGVLARAYPHLDRRDRAVVVAATVAIATNLMFAASWQGTDLERYFPSLPFQLLLIALAIRCSATHRLATPYVVMGLLLLTGVAVCNWYGTFKPVLAPDSLRQTWLRELRRATSAGDLVVLLGPRMSVIVAPHDPRMPKIDNVSNEIVMRGAGWRDAELRNIAATRRHGGHVFLADSLFGPDSGPRNGWSFKDFPDPSAEELRQTFLPYKSDRGAFVAAGEQVWRGKN